MDACVRFQAARRQLDTIQLLLKDEVRHMDSIDHQARRLLETRNCGRRPIKFEVKHPYIAHLNNLLHNHRDEIRDEDVIEKSTKLDIEMRSAQEQLHILQLLEEHEIKTMEESIQNEANQISHSETIPSPSRPPVIVAEPVHAPGTVITTKMKELVSPQRYHSLPSLMFSSSALGGQSQVQEPSAPATHDASTECYLLTDKLVDEITSNLRQEIFELQKDLLSANQYIETLKGIEVALVSEKAMLNERIIVLEDAVHDEKIHNRENSASLRDSTQKAETYYTQLNEWKRKFEETSFKLSQTQQNNVDLGSRVSALETQLGERKAECSTLSTSRTSNLEAIESLKTDNASKEQALLKLREHLDKLEMEHQTLKSDNLQTKRELDGVTAIKSQQEKDFNSNKQRYEKEIELMKARHQKEMEDLKLLYKTDCAKFEKDIVASHSVLCAVEQENVEMKKELIELRKFVKAHGGNVTSTLRSPLNFQSK